MRFSLRTLGLAAVALVAMTTGAFAEGGIDWKPSFDEAIAAAKSGNKLVMADIYTDW